MTKAIARARALLRNDPIFAAFWIGVAVGLAIGWGAAHP